MNSHFPNALAKGERQKVEAYITSTTTNPRTVWDEAYITAKEALTIEYVEGSAHIYNKWDANGTELGADLFTSNGVFLGLNDLDGLVLGCDQFAGTVIYKIKTIAVDNPAPTPDPDPEPTPDPEVPDENPEPTPEPEIPEELPTTGPAEIALAVVIVLAISAGGFYWYKTHKAVKKVTKRAKGKK